MFMQRKMLDEIPTRQNRQSLGPVGMARSSAVARVSEAPPEISCGAPHTLLAYYYELQ